MQIPSNRLAANVRAALTLLGRAVTRLPLGVDEPVLVGHSALELYSGGAWSYGELDMVMHQPRALNAALMAEGFRWTERPRHVTRGLWHPRLQIAAEIVAHALPDGAADPVATLTVELDAAAETGSEPVQLRVIGIEDLITERAARWMASGGSRVELARQMQMLMELGHAGVGGPLRIEYLRRRLANVTAGEVELGVFRTRSLQDHEGARRITETAMLAAIRTWRVRHGMSEPVSRWAPGEVGRARSLRKVHGQNDRAGREGDFDFLAPNVVAIDRPSPPPRR